MLISGKRVRRELDVDDRAGDGDDPPVRERPPSALLVRSRWRSCRLSLARSPCCGRRPRRYSASADWRSASAPPTISMISVVMASWRARFITRRRVLISSSAFSVAAAMARWRAVCSRGRRLEQRPEERRLGVARHELDQQLGRLGLEVDVTPRRVALRRRPRRSRRSDAGARLGQRQELTGLDHLGPGRQEAGRDQHEPGRPRSARNDGGDAAAMRPGVLEGRPVA